MKIGIDCRTILNPGKGEQAGVGHYTYYLLKNLLAIDKKNKYVLFFDSRFAGAKEFEQSNVKINFFPFYQYKKYLPITYSQMLISALLNREKLDVFHSPANVIPLPYTKTSVVTIHDLAIYKYPNFFPKTFLNRQTFSTRLLVPRSLEKASKIIAISKSTKKDIIEEFNINEDKIEVVYEGIVGEPGQCPSNSKFHQSVKDKFGIRGPYILFIGTIEPRKNLLALIKAFRNAKMVYDSPIRDYQLVIAGAKGWNSGPIFEAIADANASILGINPRRSGQERRLSINDGRSKTQIEKQGERRVGKERRTGQPIRPVGYVSHQEKVALLCRAEAFVFPSLYEGFGLPVLEAMNLGTPVITSDVSSLPEVVEDAAILINPQKESDISDAIIQLATDQGLRENLKIKGTNRAAQFSWEKCAIQTLDVYEQAFNSK